MGVKDVDDAVSPDICCACELFGRERLHVARRWFVSDAPYSSAVGASCPTVRCCAPTIVLPRGLTAGLRAGGGAGTMARAWGCDLPPIRHDGVVLCDGLYDW